MITFFNIYIIKPSTEEKNIKKIFSYFILFLVGTLLPFIIVEFYFKDYLTIIIMLIIASIVLTSCVSYEYLKIRFKNQHARSYKKIDYLDLLQKKKRKKRVF